MDMTLLSGLVKLLLVLAVCYVAGACLFARRNERNGLGQAILCFAAGLCLVSFLFLLSKLVGSALIVLFTATVLLISLYAVRRPALGICADYRPAEWGWALAITAANSLPVLIMGARMGAGDFPAEFFAADSPYFLHHVYALAGTGSYPPPSLEVYGDSTRYHYGFQAFVALASLLTQLKPHTTMFTFALPLLEVLTGLLVYDLCRKLTGSHGAALACLALVLLGSKQYFVNYLDPGAWAFITRPENFNFRYAHPSSTAGLLITLCIVRGLLEFERADRRAAALFFTVLLPLFKIPYLVAAGAGLALVYLSEMRKRANLRLTAELAGAGLLSGWCFATFADSGLLASAKIGLAVPGFVDMTMAWQLQTLAVWGAAALVTAAATRQRPSEGAVRVLTFALSPFLVFSAFSFENGNEYQIFDLALKLGVLFAAAYTVTAWLAAGPRIPYRHAIVAAGAAGLAGPGAVSLAHHVYVVTAHPEWGHEYTDNRSIADALRRIPLENTLLATNDLRYPANGYLRDYRQFQLAGLFGHRNLASNLWYGNLSETDRRLYASFARLFQRDIWPAAEIARLRKSFPLTHLLIHKRYPHAATVPLALVYENADYAVYAF